MTKFDYEAGRKIADNREEFSFYGIIQAALRRADSFNYQALKRAFPETEAELHARYHAPGGDLPGDEVPVEIKIVDVSHEARRSSS